MIISSLSDQNKVRATPPRFHMGRQQMSYEMSAAVSLASPIRKKKNEELEPEWPEQREKYTTELSYSPATNGLPNFCSGFPRFTDSQKKKE